MSITRNFSRELLLRLRKSLNFIQVVIGPRQVGKTTGLERIVSSWKGPKLMVTADTLPPPTASWLEMQWQHARSLGEDTLFVVDEIQKVSSWSEVVKKHFDKDRKLKKMKVVLLGSASLSLQKGLSESLAGRYELIRAPHWTFQECKKAFHWKIDQFLQFGGYPAAEEITHDIKRWQSFIKEAIIEPVLSRDIQGLVTIHKPALFRQMFELAMHYPAQEISLQKLLGQLQDSGNVTTIKHYLELFEGAFLLRTLQKYSGHYLVTKDSSPKIVPMTSALIHAFTDPRKVVNDSEWRGRVFEAVIGAHLNQTQGKLFYWRDGKDEVDYVIEVDDHLFAIEVKSGRKRMGRGLESFFKRFPKSQSRIIDFESGIKLLEANDVDQFLVRFSGSA